MSKKSQTSDREKENKNSNTNHLKELSVNIIAREDKPYLPEELPDIKNKSPKALHTIPPLDPKQINANTKNKDTTSTVPSR